MKKLLLFIFLGISAIASSQKTWVTFTNSDPSEPVFRILSESNSEISYAVEVTGMYQEGVTHDTVIYQRLSVPKAAIWGYPGYPTIPAIIKRFAIPECDSVIININVIDSLILNSYNVYPQPMVIEDTVNGGLTEVFTKNDSIYGLNVSMPEYNYEIIEDGYMRNQRILKLATYPIKYNPVTQQIIAYTNFELTMTFINSSGDANVDNGLFNNVTRSTSMNYYLEDNIPPTPQIEEVQWISLHNDPNEAYNITADYLIITTHEFFSAHSPYLLEFASHRAAKSGYNIGIVDVTEIVGLSFTFNNPTFETEQKIRDFIKRVYEGKHAQNTIDGRVAFVLLVGDADENKIDNITVPTSKDPDPTGQLLNGQLVHYSDNDYYYSCVTVNSNIFDMTPDLFIGRFPADDATELHNIVKKTKEYENEALSGTSKGAWRTRNVLAYGGGGPVGGHEYFCSFLKGHIEDITPPDYTTSVIDAAISQHSWNFDYVKQLNNYGSKMVIDYGHGNLQVWCQGGDPFVNNGALTLDYKIENLENSGMYPFALANACLTARFDFNTLVYEDCIAEQMIVYSPDAGYVASMGSWPTVGLSQYSDDNEFPAYWYETIPYSLYNNLSSLLGECVMEGLILSENHDKWPFQYILFGDPALNLMSEGYELTHDVDFDGTLKISTPTYIRENATLALGNISKVVFEKNGQLIIQGKLVIGDHVEFIGRNMDNVIRVEGSGIVEGYYFGTNPPDPIPINKIDCYALAGTTWRGFEFDNPGLQVTFKDGSFANCSLTGILDKLELTKQTTGVSLTSSVIDLNETNVAISNSTFSNTNIILNNYQDLDISASILQSSFINSNSDVLINIEHYPEYLIEDNQISYSAGTGISVSYSGRSASQHEINENIIEKTGDPQDLSWGVSVYHSFADIYNNYITKNKYGILCMNQSSVTILGNSTASQDDETQRLIENYQNQVRSFDNSFPYEFHYNVISPSTDALYNALIYYKNSASPEEDPPLPDGSLMITCNCLPSNPVFYPLNAYTYMPTWCPGGIPCSSVPDEGDVLYELAALNMDSANYSTAETQLKEVISTYPGSNYAREAAKKLIPLKKLSDNDFTGLQLYYDTTIALHEDTLTGKLVYRLKNRCNVEKKAYEDAVLWYEQDILNPASLADSVYSLIDLSDTYLLMAADSTKDAKSSNYTGTLTQYKPANPPQYRKNRNEWIKLLFREITGSEDHPGDDLINNTEIVLKQNHPNPFISETTLEYTIKETSDMQIVVTSVAGQVLMRLNKPNMSPGQYRESFNLNDYPDGVYFFSLYMNNQNVARTKGIKMH